MHRLTVSSDRLSLLVDGVPLVWRGTLDWPLYGRYLNEGASVVDAVIADRVSVGANTICLAAQLAWWPNLNPTNPKWWDDWRPFVQLALDRQVRVCIVVFCDTATYPAAYLAHWERLYVTLGDFPNVTLVVMNQPGHPTQDNGNLLPLLPTFTTVPVAGFPRLLFARDNPFESANPTLPAGDFALYCCSRDPGKFFNIGASMAQIVNGWPEHQDQWPGTHGASVLFEPWHAKPTGVYGDAGLWRQIARSLCFKGNIGGNFYSDQCSQAALLTGVERGCAVEYLGNIPNA